MKRRPLLPPQKFQELTMTIRMLVDALHEEETRVVIADDNHVIDFDIESSTKRQVKGNIYLAKVTRVEPSLQAAFVEYGAGRQGFLPFSEIHADYYQIPVADKQELLRAQAEEREAAQKAADAELDRQEALGQQNNADTHTENSENAETQDQPAELIINIEATEGESQEANTDNAEAQAEGNTQSNAEIIEVNEEKVMEDLGGDDPLEQQPRRQAVRRYKIQEVIKKNQVMLIQVIKEERGNKGASVTTYISLPGRYCVLMPNTSHGGGVSRKINDAKERRKLKELLEGLDLNDGMSLIIRTAGMGHSKADIARDYSYLIRLWNKIRELTLSSSAPALVYEEGNVIKRSIRDFFNNDVDELVISGTNALETARDFVRMLLPTQVDKVIEHTDIMPVFQKYGVERHLSSMNDSTVVMRSGGYIVLDSTEALISIDVNSGRATGERNVEDTATRTNIEAAQEIARQLRLRDLAGLIVIDFIDMMDSRHRRQVERALKDALKADRAKIQVGRISPFGLLEMSRQRLRPSLNEIQMIECPTCKGVGHVRSHDSAMLYLMRAIENEIAVADYDNFDTAKVHVSTSADLALHLLNNKRQRITELENQYNFHLVVQVEHMPMSQFSIQLEDVNGNRSRIVSSEDKDSRLPQSRGDGKGRRRDRNRGKNRDRNNDRRDEGNNRPAPVSTVDIPSDDQQDDSRFDIEDTEGHYDNQHNREGGGRRNRRNRNRNRNRDNRQPQDNQQQNAEGQVEGNTDAEGNGEMQQDNQHQHSNNNGGHNAGRRGDRYEGRRNRRNRGRRNGFQNNNGNNIEGSPDHLQDSGEGSYESSQSIEGEVAQQYQPQQQPRAPKADVVELERKAPAEKKQSEDYPAQDNSEEDSDKTRSENKKGGWWRKK